MRWRDENLANGRRMSEPEESRNALYDARYLVLDASSWRSTRPI